LRGPLLNLAHAAAFAALAAAVTGIANGSYAIADGPVTASAAADPAAARAAVDRYIAAEMHAQRIPGLSLAVRQGERLVYVKSNGVATLEHPVPVSPQTLFQIGSIGKQFTATAVMLLAREASSRSTTRSRNTSPRFRPPGARSRSA